jgi:PAS domain S-box-containing protein
MQMKYLDIINYLPEPVYWADKNSVLLGCNEAEAKLFGLTVEEAIGKNMHNFCEILRWDRKIADVTRKNDIKIMETGIAQSIEEHSLSLDGKITKTFLSHKAPLFDANRRVIGFIGTSFDITKRKTSSLLNPNCPNLSFTKREKECIHYFLLGQTIRFTANKLFISQRTVETHLQNIKVKLGCNKKSDLIAELIKHGFKPGQIW